MAFRFKQFTVEDDRSSMRVGTDAVLLGSWIRTGKTAEILEIGTGCGVIALMMAQRSTANITAVEIDRDSARQASRNFSDSPWHMRMKAMHVSFQDFAKQHQGQFDLIATNPPWFTDALKSPVQRKNIARHDDALKPGELFTGIKKLLSGTGSLYIIVPSDYIQAIEFTAKENNLFPIRQLIVTPKQDKNPNRVIMEFSFVPAGYVKTEKVTIRMHDNSFTEDYREMTKEFYLDF